MLITFFTFVVCLVAASGYEAFKAILNSQGGAE